MKKSMFKIGALALLVTAVVLGCNMANPMSYSSGSGTIPADTISDQARVTSSSFTFETVFPVGVSLTVLAGDSDGYPPVSGAIISLTDQSGETVASGRTDDQGEYDTSVVLPSAPQDIEVSVEATGYKTRRFTVADMVKLSAVKRVLYMVSSDGMSVQATAVDSDGDGVPDVYDAEPNNADVAFKSDVPGVFTVAYEDLFLQASAGDADYNDFIAQYDITQSFNGNNKLVSLEGSATAVTKLAGYDHRFGIYVQFQDPLAATAPIGKLQVTYLDENGNVITTTKPMEVKSAADIKLFDHTSTSVGKTTKFTLTFYDNPLNPSYVDAPPYDPYLYVYNTGYDIHLIGEEPLPGSKDPKPVDPDRSFVDKNGFPWALLVPTQWEHPNEGQRIEVKYPTFTTWRESGGALYPDWYLRIGQEPGPIVTDPLPPYPVIDPANPTAREVTINIPKGGSYSLAIEKDSSGNADPNGDAVIFVTNMSDVAAKHFVLNADTGEFTNVDIGGGTFGPYKVWSQEKDTPEKRDTSDNPLLVTISVGGT